MHNFTIQGKRRAHSFSLPQNLDELSGKQLTWLLKKLPVWRLAWVKFSNAKFTKRKKGMAIYGPQVAHYLVEALVYLSGAYRLNRFWGKGRVFFNQSPEEVQKHLQQLEWIFDQNNARLIQPFERVRIGLKYYYGPGNYCENLTGLEFHMLSQIDHQKLIAGNIKAQCDLLSILYRPKGKGPAHNPKNPSFTGDIRQKFNISLVEDQSVAFNKMPSIQRYVLVLFWLSCKEHIEKNNPRIFSRQSQEAADSAGWLPVFRMLAKDPLRFEEAGRLPLSDILFELNQTIQEVDRAKNKRKLRKV